MKLEKKKEKRKSAYGANLARKRRGNNGLEELTAKERSPPARTLHREIFTRKISTEGSEVLPKAKGQPHQNLSKNDRRQTLKAFVSCTSIRTTHGVPAPRMERNMDSDGAAPALARVKAETKDAPNKLRILAITHWQTNFPPCHKTSIGSDRAAKYLEVGGTGFSWARQRETRKKMQQPIDTTNEKTETWAGIYYLILGGLYGTQEETWSWHNTLPTVRSYWCKRSVFPGVMIYTSLLCHLHNLQMAKKQPNISSTSLFSRKSKSQQTWQIIPGRKFTCKIGKPPRCEEHETYLF